MEAVVRGLVDFLDSALIYAVMIDCDLANMSRNWQASGAVQVFEPEFFFHPCMLSLHSEWKVGFLQGHILCKISNLSFPPRTIFL